MENVRVESVHLEALRAGVGHGTVIFGEHQGEAEVSSLRVLCSGLCATCVLMANTHRQYEELVTVFRGPV